MPLPTRARCTTEKRNLSDWSTDPAVAEAAKSRHQAIQPSHSVMIIAEQAGSLVLEANISAGGVKRARSGAKEREGTKRRDGVKARGTGKGTTSSKRAAAKKQARRPKK